LTKDIFEDEKIKLTPDTGFDLVGIDYFAAYTKEQEMNFFADRLEE
jgi:hypothetical protein